MLHKVMEILKLTFFFFHQFLKGSHFALMTSCSVRNCPESRFCQCRRQVALAFLVIVPEVWTMLSLSVLYRRACIWISFCGKGLSALHPTPSTGSHLPIYNMKAQLMLSYTTVPGWLPIVMMYPEHLQLLLSANFILDCVTKFLAKNDGAVLLI